MTVIRCRLKGYIQPFERTLAFQELSALTGAHPERADHAQSHDVEFTVTTSTPVSALASSLAYWEAVATTNKTITTTQSLRESTVNVVRNGIDLHDLKNLLPFVATVPLPNRRCLRYGTHGIHEYRGKFFPQLVRSLINISGTKRRGVVADPMSGSGTTIVESLLFGCTGLGLDMNPLSTFLAKTKCELLSANPAKLKNAYISVREHLLAPGTPDSTELAYFNTLPRADQEYLRSWFSDDVLAGLDEIASLLKTVRYAPARNLMWAALSNILRSVSWQKEDDLRVRKEVRLDVEIDPKREFLEELARSVRAVLAFLYQEKPGRLPAHKIEAGDARLSARIWSSYKGEIDTVITSPPYATALPYLDTDRLSLCYLGLLPRPEHRKLDQLMIGNREISERARLEYVSRFDANGSSLPKSVCSLIHEIGNLNEGTAVGFRRKNLPALLSKYFFDMRDVLTGIRDLIKPGRFAFLVVGNNHTIAGGKRVEIRTAKLLADIAKSMDFDVRKSLPMDMLTSRDIFRKNAMATEEILFLRKPT